MRRDLPRPLPERPDRLRVFARWTPAHAAEDFLRPHPRELRAASWTPAAMRWCPSFSTAKTPGNTTTRTAGRSCASCTAASPTTPAWSAVTSARRLRRMAPEPLDHIFPGSWINANFDVWIGAEEDNQAWTQLLRARARPSTPAGATCPRSSARLAFEELLIAEGSDWCWWYGPGARLGQPHRVRPALPQPPGQRLPLPEPDAARGTLAPDSADRRRATCAIAPSGADPARASTAKSRRTSSGSARACTAWTSAPAPCTARSSW